MAVTPVIKNLRIYISDYVDYEDFYNMLLFTWVAYERFKRFFSHNYSTWSLRGIEPIKKAKRC